MAQGSQGCKDINISICKIKKQVAGNHLVTTGSACVLRWPWEIATSTSQAKNQTFVVTTSQVVNKCDLNSSTVWKAEFLPMRWQRSEKFSLNDAVVHEVSIPCSQNHAITLTLIPTKSLHTQKTLSRWRSDQLQSSRSQLCNHKENELESQATDGKYPLCFVLSETTLENDKFSLHCYQLCTDESGSHFLQDHGNKAQLRTLKDFPSTEKPRGSIILNEEGDALGFLAFDGKDEIIPLFVVQSMRGDEQEPDVSINIEGTKTADALPDLNRNKNQFPNPIRKESSTKDMLEACGEFERHSKTSNEDTETGSHSGIEDPDQGLELQGNEQMFGNRSEPLELSYVSQAREGNGDDDMDESESGDGEEEGDQPYSRQSQAQRNLAQDDKPDPNGSKDDDVEEVTFSAGATSGVSQNPGAKAPPIMRAYSEQMTPRSRRKFLKSRSVMPAIPLRPGALVANVILHHVYVMDAISRRLDVFCKGNQNWRHLAILNDVSTDLQLKWQSGERHCRSEKMFEVVFTIDPDLLIGTLQQHLRDLKINNVEHYLRSLHLEDHMKVEAFLESADLNIPGKVLNMLNQLPEETWLNLGVQLGVDREKLKRIKIDGANQQQNPAGHVINLIYSSDPTMTIGQFKKHLKNIERAEVAKKLDELQDCKSTIGELLDDLDLMRVVTSMLNGPDNPNIKNYKDLADECGISRELYESLQPPCADSPTKEVIDDIVRRRPTFTVEELFANFRVMKRLDVIQAISCYFVEEDMMAMKRKLQISYE